MAPVFALCATWMVAPLRTACADDDSSLAIFDRRIKPLLAAERPSSCAECHLSGVDLKDYIRENELETFAALRAGGLVDIKSPDESKLLKFIARSTDQTPLISAQVREEEYAAFRAWIRAAVKDEKLLAARGEATLGSKLPPEVIRHARSDRVLASFVENVWSEALRCQACHSPEANEKQAEKWGEQVSWIHPRDPAATMRHLVEKQLIDLKEPEKSLILAKPTMQVEHGGGQKMIVGDRTYQQFRRFVDDYAAVVGEKYQSADDLPQPAAEVSKASEIWLKIEGLPQRFDKQLLRADVYRIDAKGRPLPQRWATGDRGVAGDRGLWQQHLTLTALRNSPRATELAKNVALPPGRYLVKIFVDREGRAAADEPYEPGNDDLVGEVELPSARWTAGYGEMTVIQFPRP